MPSRDTITIDLNADMGESPERLADGSDVELMRHITSANVACGGHAGDLVTMQQTLELAREHHIAVGAHPSYPDRAGFGRRTLTMGSDRLQQCIVDQLNELLTVARRLNIPVVHVKPHGALYHSCNRDAEIARVLSRAVRAINPQMVLVGQAGSASLNVYREMGLRAAAEAFADRAYEPDGSLRDRSLPGALLDSPDLASAQAVAIATRKKLVTPSGNELAIAADTLCIHSDTPGSADIARAVRERLVASGVLIQPLRGSPESAL